MAAGRGTWEHLLHVDLALLEEVRQPLSVLQLGRLLQAEQEEGEVGAVLQGVGQLGHAHQLRDDGPRCKLGQVGLHQGHVQLDLRALVQDVEESLHDTGGGNPHDDMRCRLRDKSAIFRDGSA